MKIQIETYPIKSSAASFDGHINLENKTFGTTGADNKFSFPL